METRLSLIIPVYNRPDEIRELLESLVYQQGLLPSYEVIIVEDGSVLPCEDIVNSYQQTIEQLLYISTPNGGPSKARNIGAQKARGEYLVFLDSDVVLPPNYLQDVAESLDSSYADAFGGADKASKNFSPIQQAINYAMTSILTTGGIRGGKSHGMEQFKPRSYNMGCRRILFEKLRGFDEGMRFGEDIDFSLRLLEAGARVLLFPKAWVYHKRRVSLTQFFKQVYNSGMARIYIENRHPGSTRLVHLLPAVFTILSALSIISVVGMGWMWLLGIVIFLHALGSVDTPRTALLATVASFVQLWGYGLGYMRAWWGKHIERREEFSAFKNSFYD